MLDWIYEASLDWIYNTPPWLSSIAFILGGIIVVIAAQLVARAGFAAETRRSHNALISFAISNIVVVYSVLLSFIAVASWTNLIEARKLVETEAAIVENLYLDAGTVGDNDLREKVRSQLRRYITLVVDQEWSEQRAGGISRAALAPLRELRRLLQSYEPPLIGDANVKQESLRALDTLLIARRDRIDAAEYHIPVAIWVAVVALGVVTVGFAALWVSESRWMHAVVMAGLSTAMIMMVALIVQLDYPFRGSISINPEPFERILPSFGESPGRDVAAEPPL
jgi:hypothetical protein